MNALVVVDMVNDFVTGKLRNPRSEAIIPNIQELLRWGRQEGRAVIFVNDAHLPTDFELRVWGDHALAGTEGAAIIPELGRDPDDPYWESAPTRPSSRRASTPFSGNST